jgi:hypothetical protein
MKKDSNASVQKNIGGLNQAKKEVGFKDTVDANKSKPKPKLGGFLDNMANKAVVKIANQKATREPGP